MSVWQFITHTGDGQIRTDHAATHFTTGVGNKTINEEQIKTTRENEH